MNAETRRSLERGIADMDAGYRRMWIEHYQDMLGILLAADATQKGTTDDHESSSRDAVRGDGRPETGALVAAARETE